MYFLAVVTDRLVYCVWSSVLKEEHAQYKFLQFIIIINGQWQRAMGGLHSEPSDLLGM